MQKFVTGLLQALLPTLLPGRQTAAAAPAAATAADCTAEAAACGSTHLFALAGIDCMLDCDASWKVLEFNFNPAAPPVEACSPTFRAHLGALLRDAVASTIACEPRGHFVDVPLPGGE